jgi:hypothetical protein
MCFGQVQNAGGRKSKVQIGRQLIVWRADRAEDIRLEKDEEIWINNSVVSKSRQFKIVRHDRETNRTHGPGATSVDGRKMHGKARGPEDCSRMGTRDCSRAATQFIECTQKRSQFGGPD